VPKVGGGQVGQPPGWPGVGELLPQINGGAHSLRLQIPLIPPSVRWSEEIVSLASIVLPSLVLVE
jgi:hypothetical protein